MERNAQHAFDAEEVMAYLDGELEARRAAALAAHLVSCNECQEVAQGFRALSERMLSFEVEHPSAGGTDMELAADVCEALCLGVCGFGIGDVACGCEHSKLFQSTTGCVY